MKRCCAVSSPLCSRAWTSRSKACQARRMSPEEAIDHARMLSSSRRGHAGPKQRRSVRSDGQGSCKLRRCSWSSESSGRIRSSPPCRWIRLDLKNIEIVVSQCRIVSQHALPASRMLAPLPKRRVHGPRRQSSQLHRLESKDPATKGVPQATFGKKPAKLG